METIEPGSFSQINHWYPNALSATIHPLVSFFMSMSQERILERYCNLHPIVKKRFLRRLLAYRPSYYQLAGADLLHVTTDDGKRQMIVLENNSCPAGQKSMPLLDDNDDKGGYYRFVDKTLIPTLKIRRKTEGKLAVIYEENLQMEASGYAAAMADRFKEPVLLATFRTGEPDPEVRIKEKIVQIRDKQGNWLSVRAALRYITQQPWNRFPIQTRTIIFNPIITCLAGGRNKIIADKAYSSFNTELIQNGLKIVTPETIWDVNKKEVPIWVRKFGGKAVVKTPYSNAGQGVFTIVNQKEMDHFMKCNIRYSQFIIQSLIGNRQWNTKGSIGSFYQVGTVPNNKLESYALDFRMMIHSTDEGYRPLSIYARRARKPMVSELQKGESSWDILGTNISNVNENGIWESDISRLLLMDRKGFNQLGIGLDELIDAYLQTVLTSIAIDKMARNLINTQGNFRLKLFSSLNNDPVLLDEIMKTI